MGIVRLTKEDGSSIEVSDVVPGLTFDGYHTIDELYKHRNYLFCLLVSLAATGWKSRYHHDGSKYEGYFIAGFYTSESGKLVTYHLPDELWEELAIVEEWVTAPEYDGHDSNDVLERLLEDIRGM